MYSLLLTSHIWSTYIKHSIFNFFFFFLHFVIIKVAFCSRIDIKHILITIFIFQDSFSWTDQIRCWAASSPAHSALWIRNEAHHSSVFCFSPGLFWSVSVLRLTVGLLVASASSWTAELLGLAAAWISNQQSSVVLNQDVLYLLLRRLVHVWDTHTQY